MKNLNKKNSYKNGIETFLLMYLNYFQFVLGEDLDYVAKDLEEYNEDSGYNIYFVLRRPKVTIDPKSIQINGNKVKLDFIVHQKNKIGVISSDFELRKSAKLKIKTEYPYNLFTISDKGKHLLTVRPSALIDSPIIKNNVHSTILDYEVLYIGQSYGKDGKRSAIDRLASHETLQKIYTHSLSQHPNSDIWIMLANFAQTSLLFVPRFSSLKKDYENQEFDEKKAENFFENNGLVLSEKQKINLTEAALIKYFEPEYNEMFKENFPSSKHKSYSECYDLDIRAISVELNPNEPTRKLYTKKVRRKKRHLAEYEFMIDNERATII